MRRILATLFLGVSASFSVLADTITVEHQMGSVELNTNPERVVVIGLGALDVVNAMGVEPVAISTVSQFPDYLAQYRDGQFVSAGSLFEPDFETIYTQKPDLIIVGPRGAGKYQELSKIAPTIVFGADSNQGYWPATKADWRMLANVFDKQAFVEKKIETLDKQFAAIQAYNQSNGIDTLTIMSAGSNITTFGPESRFAVIYKDFGFLPTVGGIKESRHGELISYEYIREANPSTMLVIDKDSLVNKGKSTTRSNLSNDLVKATKAYKNEHIAYLNLSAWYLAVSGINATEQMVSDVQSVINL